MSSCKTCNGKRRKQLSVFTSARFPMFGEDPECNPSGMASPLTVKGSGGLSRDELGSGIPVMGGVAGGESWVLAAMAGHTKMLLRRIANLES